MDIPSFLNILPISIDLFPRPPTDKALEIKLGSDAKIHVQVKRIVMRNKGSGGSASRNGIENWRINLNIAPVVQKSADGFDNPAPCNKGLPDLGIDDQIHIPLPVPQVHILQSMPFSGRLQ